ncbi:leucine-rich repeat-containing G-protein coupled receptor 5-like [Haliotis cracherodii]|uniref:leucine-rich repeat-containing G-protein coupled receptor 5-like n=1 Tax=Haliotis cracherodii TaxID=6455 RepID=UPI0039E920AB
MYLVLRTLRLLLLWILYHHPSYPWGCTGQMPPHVVNSTVPCPKKCVCTESNPESNLMVVCIGQNLTAVPPNLSRHTTHLDLGMNNISHLPETIFRKLESLKELRLASNHLKKLPRRLFRNVRYLQTLWLQGNKFKVVPRRAIQSLDRLMELKLETNQIEVVPPDSFRNMRSLEKLWLDTNNLKSIPVAALSHLPSLAAINLNENEIKKLPSHAFANNTKLSILLLADNMIEDVSDDAFVGLSKLRILDFQRNRIKHIPVAFKSLTALEELNIDDNRVEYLPDNSFSDNQEMKMLQLKGNPITDVGTHAFSHLPRLGKITLSEARDMTEFPELKNTPNLEFLRFDRASIKVIPNNLCPRLRILKSLDVHSNRVSEIPNLSNCSHLLSLNLGNNEITSLQGKPFRGLRQLTDLVLVHNYVTYIPADAFTGLHRLLYLDLAFNRITEIHMEAFVPLNSLEDLNVGENHIPVLPTEGLRNLTKLKTYHNTELREFPPKETFPKIELLILSYAYHCCDFLETETDHSQVELKEDIVWLKTGNINMGAWDPTDGNRTFWNSLNNNNIYVGNDDTFDVGQYGDYDPWPYNTTLNADTYLQNYKTEEFDLDLGLAKPPITCKPKPGPFMPCDDLFGWWSLRCGVWFVFMLAVLGNGVVLFVSVTSRSKMDVPRFLICNLACADFFMGIYLGFLAIVDASTLGEFKKHAIWWQLSPGCVIAGFLGVLSSELSVFTLTVITMERFYAITHAMQLNKRLSLRHASYIMLVGWCFSILIASLPIFGISDFRKFAVCLPFEISGVVSKGYVCFIMIFNGISFFIILSCYFIMYLSIRDSQAWNSNDMRVAKRMALLVFTDFVCWAPIAFLSLAAAFGKNLIHLNEAKVLTIFILPLNSCANPFLYAIFTKQFKKDCVLLCRRLEDSSIARHFSRVSNRHGSSWVPSRRPSGLNSLVPGEKRGSNSNSMSIGSQYGGLINYHSESNNVKSESERSECDSKQNNTKPFLAKDCPYCKSRSVKGHKTKRNNKKNVEHRKHGSGRPDADSHIILHQEFCSKEKMDDLNCTTESYLTYDEDDNHHRAVWIKQSGTVCVDASCSCYAQKTVPPLKGQITLPVVAFQGHQEKVNFHSHRSKSQKKTPWTQNIPCCSTESSPIDTDKHCDYDAVLMPENSNGSSDRCVQCCSGMSTNSRSKSAGVCVEKLTQSQFDIQLVIEDGSHMRSSSKKRRKSEEEKHGEAVESSFVELKGKPSCLVMEPPDQPGDTLCVRKRKKEKIDKNVHLRFFTQSLAEHDFIQSSVGRSNSLVELTQPQLTDLYRPPCKRLSLTPGQEGYMLLNNTNRDSAFVDDDDEFDFSHRILEGYADGSFFDRKSRKYDYGLVKRRQTADDAAEEEETTKLLFDSSDKVIGSDESEALKSSVQNMSSLKSCDKESGFVSEL